MDIFLFHEVLDHVARVERVLTSPGGSLLLSGRSGVGRRSSVHLVAHLHQLEVVTPRVSRNYSLKHFRNDLKNVSTLYSVHVYTCMYCIHVCTHKIVCVQDYTNINCVRFPQILRCNLEFNFTITITTGQDSA